jgi:hypothetical protein
MFTVVIQYTNPGSLLMTPSPAPGHPKLALEQTQIPLAYHHNLPYTEKQAMQPWKMPIYLVFCNRINCTCQGPDENLSTVSTLGAFQLLSCHNRR